MLISTNKKFIFISNTKSSSTSIESILEQYCQIVITDPPFLKHMSYQMIVKQFDILFSTKEYDISQFCKFGVFRDPVDWVISWFNYRSRPQLAAPQNKNSSNYLGNTTFEKFVESLDDDWIKPQKYQFIDKDEKSVLNFIIRQEKLEEDLKQVMYELNLDTNIKIPHKNKSNKVRIRRENIDQKIITKIKNYFQEDYDFMQQYCIKS